MDLNKIQIIIILVVIILGLSAGVAVQAFSSSKYTYTVNQTNSPVNVSSQNSTPSNQTTNHTIELLWIVEAGNSR